MILQRRFDDHVTRISNYPLFNKIKSCLAQYFSQFSSRYFSIKFTAQTDSNNLKAQMFYFITKLFFFIFFFDGYNRRATTLLVVNKWQI